MKSTSTSVQATETGTGGVAASYLAEAAVVFAVLKELQQHADVEVMSHTPSLSQSARLLRRSRERQLEPTAQKATS